MSEVEHCDIEGCARPIHALAGPAEGYIRRCALHEIASYNKNDLHEWSEQNAVDMVSIARAELARDASTKANP